MKTRTIALVLTLIMLAGMLAGCNSAAQAPTGTAAPTENAATEAEAEAEAIAAVTPMDGLKIGVVIWSVDDVLGSNSKKVLDKAAEALGVELVYAAGDLDAGSQITAIENLIISGVDGIIVATLTDDSIPYIAEICDDAGVPVALMFRRIVSEENAEEAFSFDSFVGYTCENEVNSSEMQVETLEALGCKNIGMVFAAAGASTTDIRQEKLTDTMDEKGINYYTPAVVSGSITSTDYADAINNLKLTYPDIDAIIFTQGNNGIVDVALSNLDGTGIKAAMYALPKELETAFDNGVLGCLSTGNQIDPLYSLIAVYDKIHGVPMTDRYEAQTNWIFLKSKEDCSAYNANFINEFKVYTDEEIRNMTTVYNPDMTYEKFLEIVGEYSLEMVVNHNS